MEITKEETSIIIDIIEQHRFNLICEYSTDLDKKEETVLKKLKAAIKVMRSSTELCGYHKMCVRRKINTNICPIDCKDDTRQ